MIGLEAICAACGKGIAANGETREKCKDRIVLHGWLIMDDTDEVLESYCNTCYNAYMILDHRYKEQEHGSRP